MPLLSRIQLPNLLTKEVLDSLEVLEVKTGRKIINNALGYEGRMKPRSSGSKNYLLSVPLINYFPRRVYLQPYFRCNN
jgi:hypothetical protein